ncbi:MAG: hypothetical protein ACPGRE_05400 [Flavobacteriaceae bacterium]
MSRNYHQLKAEYNVLYNGENYLNEGIDLLNEGYEEDYWEVLTVEPVLVQDTLLEKNALTAQAADLFFKSEKKAVKTIQKHSIQDYGVEQNKRIDEAYLLLGKSRYYDGRFLPALESFNFAVRNNPIANYIDPLRIWRAKTNIRLENEGLAIRRMRRLVNEDDLREGIAFSGYTALALAYESTDSIEKQKEVLAASLKEKGQRTQLDRNEFILGQILFFQDSLSLSKSYFESLVKKSKSSKKYQALSLVYLSHPKYKHLDSVTKSSIDLSKEIEDRLKNQYYLNQFALLNYAMGELTDSTTYYKRAGTHSSTNDFIKKRSWNALGDLAFDKGDILEASAYYDSILNSQEELNTLYLLSLNRKRSSMEELRGFEEVIASSDSIFKLWAMNKEEQFEYFKAYLLRQKSLGQKNLEPTQAVKKAWYFSNPSVVRSGLQSFENTYGQIENKDNWKYDLTVSKGRVSDSEKESEMESLNLEAAALQESLLDREVYGDSLTESYKKALLKSSLLYMDRFERPMIAYSRLKLLENYDLSSEELLVLSYRLYVLGLDDDLTKYKEFLEINYPSHPYTQVVMGSVVELEDTELSPEEQYQQLYYDFESKCYDEVIAQVDEKLPNLGDKQIIIKFELLKVLSLLRTQEESQSQMYINEFVLKFPNTTEAEYLRKFINN